MTNRDRAKTTTRIAEFFKSDRVKELETWNEYMHVELNRVRRIIFFKAMDLKDCEKELKVARSRPEASEGRASEGKGEERFLSGPEIIEFKETIEGLRDEITTFKSDLNTADETIEEFINAQDYDAKKFQALDEKFKSLDDKYDDLWMKKEIVLTPREDAELMRAQEKEITERKEEAKKFQFELEAADAANLVLKNEITALKLELREASERVVEREEAYDKLDIRFWKREGEFKAANERAKEADELATLGAQNTANAWREYATKEDECDELRTTLHDANAALCESALAIADIGMELTAATERGDKAEQSLRDHMGWGDPE